LLWKNGVILPKRGMPLIPENNRFTLFHSIPLEIVFAVTLGDPILQFNSWSHPHNFLSNKSTTI
jgi:hypothetical protein